MNYKRRRSNAARIQKAMTATVEDERFARVNHMVVIGVVGGAGWRARLW